MVDGDGSLTSNVASRSFGVSVGLGLVGYCISGSFRVIVCGIYPLNMMVTCRPIQKAIQVVSRPCYALLKLGPSFLHHFDFFTRGEIAFDGLFIFSLSFYFFIIFVVFSNQCGTFIDRIKEFWKFLYGIPRPLRKWTGALIQQADPG